MPVLMVGGMGLFGLAGLWVGTHFTILTELILVALLIWFNNTWYIRRMEIGALIPLAWSIFFCLGMVVGDVSYWVQVDGDLGNLIDSITNGFTDAFTVKQE